MPDDGVRNPNMKYQCKDCPFGTKTPFAIVQHEFHHKNPGRDDELYHCVVCLQGFEKDSLLQKHHKEVHNDIIYTCEFCERKFNKDRYAVYIEHLKQMHNVGDNKVSNPKNWSIETYSFIF